MRLSILRPEDLLVLEIELVNLKASPDGTEAVLDDARDAALVVVRFPPQAIAEPVWPSEGALPDPPPIRTVLAGPSRLVFRVPPGTTVPLTVDGLLGWESWEPVLAPTALPRDTPPSPGIPAPAMPTALETAIELPHRLVLSPDATGRWTTTGDPHAGDPAVQLWSAVLGSDAGPAAHADVRAIARHPVPAPFPDALDALADTRGQLVTLTSDFHLPVAFTPVPISARRLELTALGAGADLEGAWSFPLTSALPPGFTPPDLTEYHHVTALGRDHVVRTVIVGYLCGTGHRAVVVLTVERLANGVQVGHAPGGGAEFSSSGYLMQTAQVIVQQPLVDYTELRRAFAHEGRELPFKNIKITTRSARILPPPRTDAPCDEGPDIPFWILDPDGRLLEFHAVATDLEDHAVDLSLPLMFVPYSSIGRQRDIRATFDAPPTAGASATTVKLANQAVTFAPPGNQPGSTTLKTTHVRYDLEQPPDPANPQPAHAMNAADAPASYVPRFLPRIAAITASVPAVDDLLGTAEPRDLVPADAYLRHGIDTPQNPAQAFLDFVAPLPLSLPAQRGGGLASPATVAEALSRSLGPIAAPSQLLAGNVDLSAFAATRVLGTIPLLDLTGVTHAFDPVAAAREPTPQQLQDPGFHVNPPRLTSRRLPDGVESRFLWKPPLKPSYALGTVFTIDLVGADLLLDAVTRVTPGGGDARSTVTGRLRNVTLTFAKALSVSIGELSFRSESGKKVDVAAKAVDIRFAGPLEFVNSLQSILPASGFDDPPSLTADAQGVVVGYTLGVPDVGVGIFSLQNIALSAALSIPFTDRPAGVRFAVCERHKPFLITVSLFGGGGFFAVGVSTKGLESVEASLEFGGNISINLGVASGGVSVMAGIYFGMKGAAVELTGYLRCGGHLDVLGIISISVEFHLGFTYRDKDPGNEVWGQASLTVSVKVAFFSTSVTLSVERHFAGSDGDPSFGDTVAAPEWAGYLQAFA